MSAEEVAIARRNYQLMNEAYRTGEIEAFAEQAFDPEVPRGQGPALRDVRDARGGHGRGRPQLARVTMRKG